MAPTAAATAVLPPGAPALAPTEATRRARADAATPRTDTPEAKKKDAEEDAAKPKPSPKKRKR